MFTITKIFDFEYAHRVYTQNVDAKLACGVAENTCRHIHGHSGKLIVVISSEELDNRGFVLDYKELGFIKEIIKNQLDHKLVIGNEDPIRELLQKSLYGIFDEVYSGITVLPIIPTSENLAKYYFEVIEARLISLAGFRVQLISVGWSETPSSIATYQKVQ